MIHLDEFVLNEYADGVLMASEIQAVERHLADCPDCQTRLAELQNLFAALEMVEEVPLTADLSQKVLMEIQPRSSRWSRWVIGAQAVMAVILSISLWPTAEAWLATAPDLGEQTANWWSQTALSWANIVAWATAAVWQQAETTTYSLNLPAEQWLWLIGLALLLWLVGNGLLLQPQRRQTIS